MKSLLFAVLFAFPLLAGIDGTVVNKTTGAPQADVILQLLQPTQQGLQTIGTVRSDAAGKFHFDQEPAGPKLVQAIYAGVLYTHMIPPGTPTSGVEVPIYDATKDRTSFPLARRSFSRTAAQRLSMTRRQARPGSRLSAS